MTGTVVQVNISPGGVPNSPIEEGNITRNGIVGDGWMHPQFHGGAKRAILLIAAEVVDELAAKGFPVFYGALGENITSRGLDRHSLRLGQRFRVGQAVIELALVRLPCDTLSVFGTGIQKEIFDALAMAGNAASPVWGMSGFYCSVVEPGTVRPRDVITLL